MSKNYNRGRQNNYSGVGSSNNNFNQNQSDKPQIPRLFIDSSSYLTVSKTIRIFDTSTVNVRKYLQRLASSMDNEIRNWMTSKGLDASNVPDTIVDVKSIDLSKGRRDDKFAPFFLIVSGNILEGQDMYESMPEVFKDPDNDVQVHINELYYKLLFAPFMYNKNAIRDTLRDPKDRSNLHVKANRNEIETVLRYVQPKIEYMGDKKTKAVVVVLDPIEVFRQMVYSQPDSSRNVDYFIGIMDCRKIDEDNFEFRVKSEKVRDRGRQVGTGASDIRRFLAQPLLKK